MTTNNMTVKETLDVISEMIDCQILDDHSKISPYR